MTLHHHFLQVLDRIDELLGFRRAVEAVDVDDRCGVAHLIEPILDIGHSPCVGLALVHEVGNRNGSPIPELPCQLILLLSHQWPFDNGSPNTSHQASLPLEMVIACCLCIAILADHHHH
jgi:hypothetical protein